MMLDNPMHNAHAIPLVVDIDGTLIRTDLLHEAMLQFCARHPLQVWRMFGWLKSGKAHLKAALAERIDCDAAHLPLQEAVVAHIRAAQAEGRRVYLASASDHRYVEQLARRIGGIAGTFATQDGVNLSGSRKAARLNEAFGEGRYDYIGNHPVDFPIWHASRIPLVVSTSAGFSRRVSQAFPDAQTVVEETRSPRAYLKALRPHQWAKNLLVFLPLIAGHSFDAHSVLLAVLAFICFSMAASSAYLINDLLDIPGDRAHARKSRRPFASGSIPVSHGPPIAALLLFGSIGIALLLPKWFVGTLLIYVALTLTYSLFLKRRVLIDVITLAGLYTIRVFGGVAALQTRESPWLLMFSLFLFLSLAIVKRCSELVAQRNAGEIKDFGRGYHVEDLNLLQALGAAAGYGAVFVIALYISSPEIQVLYSHPERLWLLCPLILYWMSRTLLLSARDELHDDPVVFALTDRVSLMVSACVAVVALFAI